MNHLIQHLHYIDFLQYHCAVSLHHILSFHLFKIDELNDFFSLFLNYIIYIMTDYHVSYRSDLKKSKDHYVVN